MSEANSYDVEPIKASTLKTFYWCAIEAYIDHLRELGDKRVGEKHETKAMKEGEKVHGESFGLLVSPREEDTDRTILEKMKTGEVAAVNHKGYQIQGAPDEVIKKNENTVRVKELKTTARDKDKWFYDTYQMPPNEFQVQIYSWMLSQVPELDVKNPVVVVKKRKGDQVLDWYKEEIEFGKDQAKEKIDRVLNMFQSPKKLAEYRPSADFKCNNDNHWEQYKRIVLNK